MAWDGPPHMEPGYASVVMVPYASLLEQHLQRALAGGIVAPSTLLGLNLLMTSKYCISSRRRGRQPLSDSKIFISAVYIPSLTIYRFLASKKAAHVRRAISDEATNIHFPILNVKRHSNSSPPSVLHSNFRGYISQSSFHFHAQTLFSKLPTSHQTLVSFVHPRSPKSGLPFPSCSFFYKI